MSTHSQVSDYGSLKRLDTNRSQTGRGGVCLTIVLRCTPFSFSGLYLQKIASFLNSFLKVFGQYETLYHPFSLMECTGVILNGSQLQC